MKLKLTQPKVESNSEKLVIALSALLLILVCGTGFWVYNRLSNVAENIVSNRPKDTRLMILRELSNDLISAENEAYSFAFRTHDTVLLQFYILANRTAFKLNQLENLPSGDKNYLRDVDSLRSIVKLRFETLQDIVLLQSENRVDEAMEKVMIEVNSMSRNGTPEQKRKWFQRRQRQSGSVNRASINRELSDIQEDVVSKEQTGNVRRLELERRNNSLISRYTTLVQLIENKEKRLVQADAHAAKEAAQETYIVIAFFCVTSVLLILIAGYLIAMLMRKTRTANRHLRMAKNRSDQLAESKSRFLANMSHELRTPLNAIVGFSDQLSQDQLPADQDEKLEIIRKAAAHLTSITDQILDFSKIQAGGIQLEQIPLALRDEIAFVEQSVQQLAAINQNTFSVEIDDEIPAVILGDPLRLRQILMNLLSNAMKFTFEGMVSLVVKPTNRSNEQVSLLFEVKDTGIGISQENLTRIFDEFEQAEIHTTRNFGGTGLGLSITKMLVERMGGTLSVNSKMQNGTTFLVTIPFPVASSQTVPETRAEDMKLDFLAGKSVLLVDDEAYNRKLLRAILQPWNILITEAVNGKEAMREIHRADYDLILLDLRMPEMDGFQVKEALSHLDSKKSGIPVVALTAALSPEERANMLQTGWQGVLLKPLKLAELAACLRPLFSAAPFLVSEIEMASKAEAAENNVPSSVSQQAPSTLDLSSLKQLGDDSFYADMIRTLYRTTEEGLETINRAVAEEDWVSMADGAHKIASPMRHVQATAVYELLKELEKKGRTEHINPDDLQLEELNMLLKQILEQLESEIGLLNV